MRSRSAGVSAAGSVHSSGDVGGGRGGGGGSGSGDGGSSGGGGSGSERGKEQRNRFSWSAPSRCVIWWFGGDAFAARMDVYLG